MVTALVRSLRDDRFNTVLTQPAADSRVAGTVIPGQAPGAAAWLSSPLGNPHRLHHFLESRGLVTLSGVYLLRQGQAPSVHQQVQLGRKASAGVPESVI